MWKDSTLNGGRKHGPVSEYLNHYWQVILDSRCLKIIQVNFQLMFEAYAQRISSIAKAYWNETEYLWQYHSDRH